MNRKQSRMEEIFYREPFYKTLLNDLDNSVYVFDKDGRFVFLNSTAEDFEGLKNESVRGMKIDDIYIHPDYSPSLKALETGRPVTDNDNVWMNNGKRFRQMVKAYPVTEGDEIIGCYTIQRDITSLEKIVSENLDYQRNTRCAQKDVEFKTLIGENPRFLDCIEMASSTARSDLPIMLSGATGTGKEVFAKGIHNASKRKAAPFMAVNCGAIPESLLESILFGTEKGAFTGAVDKKGIFEQAKGGTVFLDELNSMPLASQVKLLRVLEEKEVRHVGGERDIKTDVRIISAMNESPVSAITKGKIREDLFYRLSVINIEIPTIKERGDDIFLLCQYFIKKYNNKFGKRIKGLDKNAESFFESYEWPGNVRQVKHTLESAISLADDNAELITVKELPQYLFKDEHIRFDVAKSKDRGTDFDKTGEKFEHISENVDVYGAIRSKEKQRIINILMKNNGNVSKTAVDMGIHRQSLIYKMKKYGIKR
ncbi:MAG: sigma-54 interaction domain-containing protein [Anaerovoracaceae bacterium]